MYCEVTIRIPRMALTAGEREHATCRRTHELADAVTHQGSRMDLTRGTLVERFYGEFSDAATFAERVHASLSSRGSLEGARPASEFLIELRITGYLPKG